MTKKYRESVGAVIVNQHGLILSCLRSDIDNAWQMPQGGINKREKPNNAIMRELKEELACDNFLIIKESNFWYFYDFPFSNGSLYRGQKQKWFVLRFLGQDSDINPSQAQSQEFCDFKWSDQNTILEEIVDFKRKVYSKVFHEFQNILASPIS